MKPSELVDRLNAANKVLQPFVWVMRATQTVQFYMNAGKWFMKTISVSDSRSHLWRVTLRPKYTHEGGGTMGSMEENFYFESELDARDFPDIKSLTDIWLVDIDKPRG
ncbi:hypothetical protein [Sphaerospermopsis aphanizomenoides]|uniref:hypothetical protein n=1 Tax=Sphaerospermopsis aphanizomenoides TaxID=459663 RepID=UPI00187EF873|nr:hypothetical protein [Sphaerospermopsis aphanizomenoides]